MAIEQNLPANGPERFNKFTTLLVARLRTLEPTFLDIKRRMGVKDEIGLGVIPETHGTYSLGQLMPAQQEGETTYYETQDFFFGHERRTANPEFIIVRPGNSETSSLVSIFQRKGLFEKGEIEERLLKAPDSVFEGALAHELGHDVERKTQRSDFVDAYLIKERSDRAALGINVDIFDPDVLEANIDVIAALFGYKTQVLAKLEYMIQCLKTYKGADDTIRGGFKTAGRAIEECQERIAKVQRYA